MARPELSFPLPRVRVKDDEAVYQAFRRFVKEKGVVTPGILGEKSRRLHSPNFVEDLMNPSDPVVYALATRDEEGEEGDAAFNEVVNHDNRVARIIRRQVRDFIEPMPSREELLRQAGI